MQACKACQAESSGGDWEALGNQPSRTLSAGACTAPNLGMVPAAHPTASPLAAAPSPGQVSLGS